MDAAIVVEDDGTIYGVYDMNDDGAEETLSDMMAQGVEVADFRGKLIMPGFVDAHAHAPQVGSDSLYCRTLGKGIIWSTDRNGMKLLS